ncbi:MAG: AraC family transcriptional regulator [Defluviitaleaceae bacterium]|nr:AraC family transcriptional regulator [Defluviitaleaceae bacterium]MCL2836939.1 AraC family transcriptional regulator [Defluviitaleaceae bacterium]
MARKSRQIIEYRLYELDADFPVILLDGDNWRISEVPSNRLHFHNCLEIGICHSDSGTIMMRDEPHFYKAGDMTCIPRFVPHTTYSDKGTSSLWSYIFADLRKLLHDMVRTQEDFDLSFLIQSARSCIFSKDENPRMYFFIESILDELRAGKNGHRTVVKALFIALFYELARINEREGNGVPRKETLVLAPALDYIDHYYMNGITIGFLADMCHLSTTHFRRLFHSIMGVSPLSFVNATRIDKACFLLQTTDNAVLDIAETVGFPSISSFNRCFSQIMGVTPRAYRNPEIRGSVKPRHRHILQYSGWFEPER